MTFKIVLILYLIDLVLTNQVNVPKVYEDVDETVDVGENNKRIARNPDGIIKRPTAFTPPVFNYHAATQQDMLKWRYLQQQISDVKNFGKNQRLVRRERVAKKPIDDQIPEESDVIYTWKVDDNKTENLEPNFNQQNVRTQIWHVSDPNLEKENRRKINVVPLQEVHLTTPSAHVERAKKSLYNYQVNEADLEAVPSNQNHQRHPDQISLPNNHLQNYLNPQNGQILKGGMAGFALVQKNEKDVEALNALIGKTPEDQLEGLKQLLQSPAHTKIIIPVINGPQPFHQPQANTTPGIDLAKIQAELDLVANAEARKVLAKAQEQAMAHVKAQHEAIARAQVEAQRAIQIQHRFQAQPTQNLQVQVRVEPAVEIKQRPQQQAFNYARPPPQSHEEPYGQQPHVQLQRQGQGQVQVQAQSQTHFQTVHVTPRPSPHEPLGQVFFKQQNLIEDTNKLYADNADELQYASQYAFGYRIRDAHNGNDFGHEEKRDGEMAKGHYHVLLPDGRTQNVEYWADDSGYHAKVTYSNFAQHPHHQI